jgi:hypothetical protein
MSLRRPIITTFIAGIPEFVIHGEHGWPVPAGDVDTLCGRSALGSNHAQTQRYVSHYARLLLDTARAAEALPLAQTALATHETASGANHSWTKDSALVTADALAALGRADEAAALRARYGLSDDGK